MSGHPVEHPEERTALLAKEAKRRPYGNEDTHAESDNINLEAASATNDNTEEVIVDYSEIEFAFGWKYLHLYLIEPLVFILLFGYNLSSTILKNQIIYQTCTAVFKYDQNDCLLLGTANSTNETKEIEKYVQPYAARIFMTTTLVESIVPAICGIFIGAWSDRFGRKPLLLAAFIGYMSYYAICAIIAYLSLSHILTPWYYLLAALPLTLLGGNVSYTVAANCFISDVTSKRLRPYRMAFYEAALYLGLMAGSLAAGYIYEATNSFIVFSISAGSILFGVLVIAIFLPESLHYRMRHVFGENAEYLSETGTPNADLPNGRTHNLLQDMWQTCFRARSFYDRSIIWLLIIVSLIAVFVINGSMTVFYLFIRARFDWCIIEYTTYETVSIFVPIIGSLLGIWLLRKLLKVSLINLIIITCLSQSASYFMKGFAFKNWHLYLAIGLGALKSLGQPMARTIITNMVPADELGKIFSFQSVLQSIVPFVATPFYTFLYSITLSSFPGFFNVLSANLFLISIAFLLVILRKKHNYPEYYDAVFN